GGERSGRAAREHDHSVRAAGGRGGDLGAAAVGVVDGDGAALLIGDGHRAAGVGAHAAALAEVGDLGAPGGAADGGGEAAVERQAAGVPAGGVAARVGGGLAARVGGARRRGHGGAVLRHAGGDHRRRRDVDADGGDLEAV